MSMIGNFVAITVDDYKNLLESEESIEAYLYPDDENYDAVGENNIDIDKTWHAIHFILTGSEWEGDEPAKSVIFGGKEAGPDVGYGSARFLDQQQVSKVNQHLLLLDQNVISEYFNVEQLVEKEIYPNMWIDTDETEEEMIDYLEHYYKELKQFYEFAADSKLCVIQYLS